jgi:hypothetical protein
MNVEAGPSFLGTAAASAGELAQTAESLRGVVRQFKLV